MPLDFQSERALPKVQDSLFCMTTLGMPLARAKSLPMMSEGEQFMRSQCSRAIVPRVAAPTTSSLVPCHG